MHKISKKTALVIGAVIIVLAVIAGVVVYEITKKSPAPTKTTNSQANKPQAPSTGRPAGVMTAGGVPVPMEWQAKAQKLGYYCPSWNSSGGQVSSTVCLPLDK